MKKWLWFLGLTLSLAASASVRAAGFIVVANPDGAGEVWVPPHPIPRPPGPRPGPTPPPFVPPMERRFLFAPLEIESVQVKTKVRDQYATTSLEEEFYNPNSRAIEGTFLMPIPKGAHVEKFAMEMNGQMVEAELLDSEKARQIYEDIVRRAKDPALLEYAGRDLLKARIFPIEPHSRKRVTVTYSELLKADNGLVSYTFPMGSGKYSAAPVKNVSLKIDLESKRPLKSIYSPSHNVEIRRHGASEATVGFEASSVKPDADFELLFAAEKDEVGLSFTAHRTGSEDGYFLLLASPGFESKSRKTLPKDVTFVLDTSGSMAGAKLEQAKKALLFCVENLNEDDHFEVIRFATETEPLFGKLMDSSADNRAHARDFIKQLKPIGGTAIDEALRKALSMQPAKSPRPYIIVFLTDGRPTVGVTDENEILTRISGKQYSGDQSTTRIFCFGIGTDVNTHLLDKITDRTRAFSQYVLPEEDIEVKVSTFFSKIKEPVLSNLRLESDGDTRITKMYPASLPDLFYGDQLVIVGRYSNPGATKLTLEGSADGETKRFNYDVRFPTEANEYAFIPRLWATRRIGYLLDEIRLHGENSELRQEVTELARQYGVVTPYTAYLILEDETRRGVPLAAQSLPRLNEDRLAQDAARNFYSMANREKSGPTAVTASRYGLALRQADNAQALSQGNAEMERHLTTAMPAAALPASGFNGRPANAPEPAKRLASYSQQSQFVNGRNFFLNGQQWVDSTVQSQANTKHVRIQFNSKEYFDLLKKEPSSAPWLALGQNVQFVLNNTVYEIVD